MGDKNLLMKLHELIELMVGDSGVLNPLQISHEADHKAVAFSTQQTILILKTCDSQLVYIEQTSDFLSFIGRLSSFRG